MEILNLSNADDCHRDACTAILSVTMTGPSVCVCSINHLNVSFI